MKTWPYIISIEAGLDLEEIWFYTAKKRFIEQADRYYSLIFDEINYICKNVQSGKIMDHVRKDYRASKVKSQLILYRLNNNVVEIIRILYERMDIDARLSE